MDILHDAAPFVNILVKLFLQFVKVGEYIKNSSLSAAPVLSEVFSSLASAGART